MVVVSCRCRRTALVPWAHTPQMRPRACDLVQNAPKALLMLFDGQNTGKMLVKVSSRTLADSKL